MKKSLAIALYILSASSPALWAVDTLQIRSVNFQAKVVELHNFAATSQDLSGWRFCSHDDDQVRQYSNSTGLNNVSVPAGGSVFIHWNNDAPNGDSSHINVSTVGTVAQPLDSGPFGLQIYFPPVSFGDGTTIGDHLQWSVGGADNGSADERSDEAEAGGVWNDQSSWIPTTANTLKIILTDNSGARLHSPANYVAAEPPTDITITDSVTTPENEFQITWSEVAPAGAFEYLIESNPDISNPAGWAEPVVTSEANYKEPVEAGNKFFRIGARLKP